MRKKKVDLKNKIAGVASLITLILSIIGTVILGAGGIGGIFAWVGFGYAGYKTLYKKEMLTTGEWVALFILIFIAYGLPFLLF